MRMYQSVKKRTRIYFIISVFIILSVILCVKTADIILNLAQIQANRRALEIINSVVNEYISQAGDMYNDMLVKDKNAEGSIFAVNTDIGKISRLQSEISVRISEAMRQNPEISVKISPANILGFKAVTEGGFRIGASISPISGIFVQFEDSFESAGINQTKFTVNLKIKADVRVRISPLRSTAAVEHTIPVAQIILLGDVPVWYTAK